MTEKKRRFCRRNTKKNLTKGGAKNFFCRDIVKAYKNKVIYLGVDLNWVELFPAFSYDLSWNADANTINFTMPSASAATAAAPIQFDMTKPNDFSKIDDAIEINLKLDGSDSKWNDNNDENKNHFKYNLNNVMLPRYLRDINTQIAEISSPFLHWNKEKTILGYGNTNEIKDEQKNMVLSSDKASEKTMMILVHEKLLEFKSKMKRVLIDTFKQRVRKNIQIIMDMIENPTGSIKRNCQFSVSGKIYFGIKVVCNSYTNFELHELIFPDPVIPALDDLPSQDNFPDLRKAVVKKFLSQGEEKIQVYMEDLDGLLLFGSTPSSSGVDKSNRKGRKGNYGKHNISFDPHVDFNGTGTDSKPNYNPEAENIFKILRKTS